jgi:hypothetical protein
MSLKILTSGDLIALEADRKGFVANPPQNEPVAEVSECVSHTRLAFYR